jgi:hypothetical protein
MKDTITNSVVGYVPIEYNIQNIVGESLCLDFCTNRRDLIRNLKSNLSLTVSSKRDAQQDSTSVNTRKVRVTQIFIVEDVR